MSASCSLPVQVGSFFGFLRKSFLRLSPFRLRRSRHAECAGAGCVHEESHPLKVLCFEQPTNLREVRGKGITIQARLDLRRVLSVRLASPASQFHPIPLRHEASEDDDFSLLTVLPQVLQWGTAVRAFQTRTSTDRNNGIDKPSQSETHRST